MEYISRNRPAVAAVALATMASLGCGTSYAFSAWGPQFADKLHFSATQTNVIAVVNNAGVNLFGLPLGYCVDRFGPRRPMLIGALSVGIGYGFLRHAFNVGPGVYGPVSASFFAFIVGLGSTATFSGAIKTAAIHWPHHRGTATSAPLAAYGLSALFFITLANVFTTAGDTSGMLLVIAVGTFLLATIPPLFLPAHPAIITSHTNNRLDSDLDLDPETAANHSHPRSGSTAYTSLSPDSPQKQNKHRSRRPTRADSRSLLLEPSKSFSSNRNGRVNTAVSSEVNSRASSPFLSVLTDEGKESSSSSSVAGTTSFGATATATATTTTHLNLTSASQSPSSSLSGSDIDPFADDASSLASITGPLTSGVGIATSTSRAHHHLDISGFRLLFSPDFWILSALLSLLAGTGIMTIYNIGHDVQALWLHHDPATPAAFLHNAQLTNVSLISFFSFLGRIISGTGSDHLVRAHRSRFICIAFSSVISILAQLVAYNAEDPRWLSAISIFTGLAYGALFGVFPAIVSDTFGVQRLSQNWGVLTLSAVAGGSFTNMLYGRVFDANSSLNAILVRGLDDALDSNTVNSISAAGAGAGPPHKEVLTCTLGRECYSIAYLVTLLCSILALALTVFCIHRESRKKRKLEDEATHRTV